MRRTVLVGLLVVFAATTAWGLTVESEVRLSREEVVVILGGRVEVDLMQARPCRDTSNLLFVARDKQTRQLRWYLVNPRLRSVLEQGACPFRDFHVFEVSPDQSTAVFHARYPGGFHALDLDTGEWARLFEDSADRLFSLSISPLGYVSEDVVMTTLDEQDEDGFVQDTHLVQLELGRGEVRRWVSLRQAEEAARSLFPDLPEGTAFLAGEMAFDGTDAFAYTLRTVTPDRGVCDHLLRFDWTPGADKPSRAEVVDHFEGRLLPLDFKSSGELLYRKTLEGKTLLTMAQGSLSRPLLEREILLARLLDGGMIGAVAVSQAGDRAEMEVLLGRPDELKSVWSSTRPFSVGFVEGGIVLISDGEIRLLSVEF